MKANLLERPLPRTKGSVSWRASNFLKNGVDCSAFLPFTSLVVLLVFVGVVGNGKPRERFGLPHTNDGTRFQKKRKTEPHEKTKKKEKKRKRAWPMGQGAWQGVGGAYFASSVQFAVAIADHRLQVAGPILRLIQSTSERFVLDGQVGTTADRWFCVLNRAGRRARRNPAGNTAKNTVQRQTPRSRAFTWFYLVLPSFFPSFTEFYRASPSFT